MLMVQSGKFRRIKPGMYVRRITCSNMYVRKDTTLLAGTGVRKIGSVACGFRPIKIHFLITRKKTLK